MNNKAIIVCIFIFLVIVNKSFSLENKIITKINNEIVTSIDVENEASYLISLNTNLKNMNEVEIFEISKRSIIREKIKNIELKKNFKNIIVPDDIIEKILKNVYQKLGIKDLKTFKEYLKKNKVDYQFVKKKIDIETLWNELIILKFESEIKINEDKIRKDFIANNDEYSKSFLVSEIFYATSNSDKIEKVYGSILKTIKNDGFNKAVLTYSSSNTASSGGNLGWIQEETLNENLKNIFLNMKEGEITKPITVPSGFLVLKIEKIKKEKKNQNIEKKINEIINAKKNNQLNQFSKIYFNKIKKDLKIDEF